jgi:hypothetical protein
MKLADFRRLCKFMQMTFSDSDNESLMALRQANTILKKENIDWDRVLNRVVTLDVEDAPPEPAPHHTRPTPRADDEAARINDAFASIEDNDPRAGFADFIASLKEQWDRKHHLTAAQKDALFRAADNAGSHREPRFNKRR